jgi:hypothetical protein
MAQKNKKTQEVERKDYHHLGTPDYAYHCEYSKDNMEYTIVFQANGSNTHFLGEHVQMKDELYLGLSEESFENLLEGMIDAVTDRLKNKLQRYNQYKKLYYIDELDGNEKEWEESKWNAFNTNE